jgi:glycerol-3-phosphate dehydrogenase
MFDIDLMVVGGGINGAGIAREAARRCLSVVLVEKDDLAAHTSSASSKLIHGGLRYLEQFELKLVRESLAERERVLRLAPHVVEPLQFVLPLSEARRPAWMIRAGLFVYDHLGGRGRLPGSRPVRLDGPFGNGLRHARGEALTYWDCRVQDSRLVVLNAMGAAQRTAEILTRTELLKARRERGQWIVTYRTEGFRERTVAVRALVNAAGPWASELFDRLSGYEKRPRLRLVKGSHIVLPQLFAGDHAFILRGPGGRVVFAIPYEREFTLIGTTEVECSEPTAAPSISEEETDYLLAVVSRHFTAPISRGDIAWSWSGIRALCDDGSREPSRVSRDYMLKLDAPDGNAPLLSVLGGKITTYRSLAEKAVDLLDPFFPGKRPRRADDPLPGGDIHLLELESYVRALALRYKTMPHELLDRLVRTYGTRSGGILKVAKRIEDLGEHFGGGLTEREVDYLIRHEWARTGEDVLWRRTKLGLHVTKSQAARIDEYVRDKAWR